MGNRLARRLNRGLVLAVGLFLSGQLLAQTAKPAAAPAKPATGHPDLSGVWVSAPPLPKGTVITPENDEADQFVYRHMDLPLQPWAKEKFDYNRDPYDPYTQGRNELMPYLNACSPQGPSVNWLFQAFPFEIIQSPKRVMLFFERDHEVRQIWTDGREHPKDFGHNWLGHSIGHWESDTLVADTIGLNDLTWFDKAGHVHSDQLHIIEKFTRIAPDKLLVNFIFDDPKTFTMPWTAKKTFILKPNWEIDEEILCEDKFLGKTIPLR